MAQARTLDEAQIKGYNAICALDATVQETALYSPSHSTQD